MSNSGGIRRLQAVDVRILAMAEEGQTDDAIAKRIGLGDRSTVCRRRQRAQTTAAQVEGVAMAVGVGVAFGVALNAVVNGQAMPLSAAQAFMVALRNPDRNDGWFAARLGIQPAAWVALKRGALSGAGDLPGEARRLGLLPR